MRRAQVTSAASVFKRAIEWWPYVFIAVSVTGLAYLTLRPVP